MASSKQVLLLAVVASVMCLASRASATMWMVGDDGGWRAAFNETGWANGKTFVVGDTLMFMYTPGSHTVAKVVQEAFATCDLNATLQLGIWTSGSDVVPLDKPGKVWFICTVPGHCNGGMKLVVDVQEATAAPAPAPFFWFPFPLPGVPAPAPAPSPWFRFPPWETRAAAPAPAWPPASPPSAAVRYPVGGAVAAAAAAVVAAALAF